jgi:alginate O-acetyltransferase complex protein AlgI
MAALADEIFSFNPQELSASAVWLGTIAYTLQIYFDFSGYSDMAIGLANMFGFRLLENFNLPYTARSIQEFWRRWHISLSTWFRDYVYIPLGGNRSSKTKTYFNLSLVFILTGFWHGASWNFVLWGFYFGCFMIIEKLLEKYLVKTPRVLRHLYTLILIVFSRAIFYFVDFSQLKEFVVKLFASNYQTGDGFYTDLTEHVFWFILVIILCIPWDEIYKKDSKVYLKANSFNYYARPFMNVVLLLLSTVMLVDATYNPFIYFRF